MSFQDKSLQCSDCRTTFTFSAEEQEQFASRGYTNEPKRCPACRQARKSERYGSSSSYGPRRQMFPAKCAECGKDTEVPFEPRGDKPVYCSDCYRKVARPRSDDRGGAYGGRRGGEFAGGRERRY
jgi:CxxC-x17-CxxC domain-containing protein